MPSVQTAASTTGDHPQLCSRGRPSPLLFSDISIRDGVPRATFMWTRCGAFLAFRPLTRSLVYRRASVCYSSGDGSRMCLEAERDVRMEKLPAALRVVSACQVRYAFTEVFCSF